MSIPKQDHQATFYDATFLAQDLFDQKDRYDIFRREVLPALQAVREDLCHLYSWITDDLALSQCSWPV